MSLATIATPVSPINALAGTGVKSAEELAKRGKIQDTAQKFEATFLSAMMQSMFEGVKTSEPFGGGQGEEMFRSLLTEAMAKEVSKSGGVGLSSTIQREMLKMQGLKD